MSHLGIVSKATLNNVNMPDYDAPIAFFERTQSPRDHVALRMTPNQ